MVPDRFRCVYQWSGLIILVALRCIYFDILEAGHIMENE